MKIKILDLNIFEGGLFWDNIVAFIQEENPDILCLQEVSQAPEAEPLNFQSMKRLTALLPKYYSYFSPEIHEVWPQGEGDGGNAIFSHFPMLTKETIFLHREYQRIVRPQAENDFSHYPKNLQHVTLEVGDRQLEVFNLHGIWGLDGADTPERLRMSQIIVENIKGKVPAVLMGDFNLKPDTETIRKIEVEMCNVFKDELATSFNMRHKTNPGYATAVVDMFFASRDIKISEKYVPSADVSDHLPLVVVLDLV